MKKSGSALITALFIMTIITIVVTSMHNKLRLDIHHVDITIKSDQLFLASQVVTYWAIEELKKEHKPFKSLNKKGKILNFPENAKDLYPDIEVKGEVYDLQALFNINNLNNEIYKPMFYTLISKIDAKIKKQQIMYIVAACNNWISGMQTAENGSDTWLDQYLKQRPTYLPSYQPMQSISELRTVYGVNAKIYNSLQPYLTALPEITQININTARKKVLAALSSNQKDEIINNIIKIRGTNPIKNLSKITKLLEEAKISPVLLTTDSTYYLVIAKTKTTNLSFTNYITLKTIQNPDNSLRVDIVKQSFNAL